MLEKVNIKFLVIGVLLLNFHRMLMLETEVDEEEVHAFQIQFLLNEITHKLIFS